MNSIKMERVEIRASGGLGALGSLGCYEDDSSSSDSSSSDIEELSSVRQNKIDSKKVVRSILSSVIGTVVRHDSKTTEHSDMVEEELSSDDEKPSFSKDTAPPKVKGEIDVTDLPPIEDLYISVPQEQTEKVGKIFSIVDSLVVVRSFKGVPAIDLDSVLFLDNGKTALGSVFDVIGPINDPFYVVRFNSSDHVKNRGIEIGKEVYFAPRVDALTSYVFLAQLRAMRGSDASWQDDVEPPLEFLDFSDDEEEREAKKALKNRKRAYNQPNPTQIANNPFYRRSRAYNPRENGPITWNSAWVNQPNFNVPPPPLPGTSSSSDDVPIWNSNSAKGYWSQRKHS